MRTESNREPGQIEIRKLGIVDGNPVVYLYLNSDIQQVEITGENKEPVTMYQYDSTQITTPAPEPLLQEIDINLASNHSYNQTDYKQRALEHLNEIKQQLGKSTPTNTKLIDRLDKATQPKPIDIDNIKKIVAEELRTLFK